MRLDKLTIGSAKNSPTHQFKNLKDVTIDFDQDHWVTVVIGWNGTGKSNVLEALAIIFRELISQKKPTVGFAFRLAYRMGHGDSGRRISIDHDPDRLKEPFRIYVVTPAQTKKNAGISKRQNAEIGTPLSSDSADNLSVGLPVKLNAFLADDANLPRYVFSYYSGESTRMHEVFRPYLERYDNKLRNGEDPGLKRLFYAMPVHSQFVLLAFLIQQTDGIREFLNDHLGLDPDEGLESVLFVLRQPPWKSKAADGDPRFWNARGVVKGFLARLYDIALAPIEVSRRVATSIWNKESLQFKYVFVKDIAALRKLVGEQAPSQFFRDLESTYVSELIEEVRIKVRLKKNEGTVTFRELSEGEQQLLTVLGLLRFTAEDESLFLLDEPDTHLNPRWSVDYLSYLKQFVGSNSLTHDGSHVVLTTHNPLAIAELVKEQVQILNRTEGSKQIDARQPKFDPRGMGYAGIVTSDMFGLAAALDMHTQGLLEKKRNLSLLGAPLSVQEREDLEKINLELDGYGFRYSSRDPLFEEYLRARYAFNEGQPEGQKLADQSSEDRRAKARELIETAAKKVKAEQDGATDASH